MARIAVAGNLGDFPELKFSQAGKARCIFSLAEYGGKDNDGVERTTWHRCVAFNEMAEQLAESFSKGMRVMVEGRLEIRSYDDDEGNKRSITEILVDEAGPTLRWAKMDPDAVIKIKSFGSREDVPDSAYEDSPQAPARGAQRAQRPAPARRPTSNREEPQEARTAAGGFARPEPDYTDEEPF